MKPHKPFFAPAAAAVRERSLAARIEAFHEADALADAVLEAVADFAQGGKFFRQADVQAFAVLNVRAYEAEVRWREARRRLLWEWNEHVRANPALEDSPPW